MDNNISVTIRPDAAEEIRRVGRHIESVTSAWLMAHDVTGRVQDRNVVTQTNQSWIKALTNMLTGNDAVIYRDGDLSFYVENSGFVYGVVFRPAGRPQWATDRDDLILPASQQDPGLLGRYCTATEAVLTASDVLRARPCLAPLDRDRGVCPLHGEPHNGVASAMPVPGEWTMHS